MKGLAAVLALLALVSVTSVAHLQTGQGGAQPNRPPGGPPPPFPGDTTAAERDSLMKVLMQEIAGKEQVAAESVFKDIQIFKGRRAGDIPRIMNYGFGRSLAVSCYHCHARGDWSKDEKKGKRIAREMSRMAAAINADYLSKIEGLEQTPPGGGAPRKPTVNCSTCHRGSIHAHP